MARAFRLTRWDARVFVRAAIVAGLAFALACIVTAVTDEGGVAWGERLGRTVPLAPICAAIGTWGALAPVCARGEVRALEALGRSIAEIAAAAVGGGAVLALASALALASLSAVNVAGFYPTTLRASVWTWEGETFVNHARGLRIDADGAPFRFALPAEAPRLASIPRGGRSAAATATALAGIALPMLLSQLLLERPGPARRWGRDATGEWRTVVTRWIAAATAAAAVVASMLLFQAAAARLMPAALAPVPPALLLAFALARYRAAIL